MKRKVDKCFSDYKRLSKNKDKSVDHLNKLNSFLRQSFIIKEDISGLVVRTPKCKMCFQLNASNREQQSEIKVLEKDKLKFQDNINKLEATIDTKQTLNTENVKLEEMLQKVKDSNSKLKRQSTEKDKLISDQNEIKRTKLYHKNYEYKKAISGLKAENI